jgi:hypothetical protein
VTAAATSKVRTYSRIASPRPGWVCVHHCPL